MPTNNEKNLPSTEVVPRAKRRRFSAEKKLQILAQYEACVSPGEKGALLRREGIYSSQISMWRTLRDTGKLRSGPRRPNADLVKENIRLKEELRKAQLVIEVQKKYQMPLGSRTPAATRFRDDDDSAATIDSRFVACL